MTTTITNALFIPLLAKEPHQEQFTTLDGRSYIIRFDWNQRIQRWTFSMLQSNGTALLLNKGLVLGSDLLRQTRHDTRIPQGSLVCIDTTGQNTDPTLDTLGVDHLLLFIRPEDLG